MNASRRIRPSLIGIQARVFAARDKTCPELALLAKAFPSGTPIRPILSFKKAGARDAGTSEAERDIASGIAARVTGQTIRHRYPRRQHRLLSPGYAATSGLIDDQATHSKASQ